MTVGNSESEANTLARLLAGGALRKRRTRRLLLARLLSEERDADDDGEDIEGVGEGAEDDGGRPRAVVAARPARCSLKR
jgi:hypothetical protein